MKKDDFLDLAAKRLKMCVDSDEFNRKAAIEDLHFRCGIDQWNPLEKAQRRLRGRPTLQINLLPKYIKQASGDMRQNMPRCKVLPIDSHADRHLARIREGIIRNIEYVSDADSIYKQAMTMQLICGYGAWMILTRYCEENPWVQEVYLKGIPNPFSVYVDPTNPPLEREYGFILSKIERDEFKERFPDKEIPSEPLKSGSGLMWELWYDNDTVMIADYFVREKKTVKMVQMEDGAVLTEEDANEAIDNWEKKYALLAKVSIEQQQAMQQQQMQQQQQQQQQQPMQQPQGQPMQQQAQQPAIQPHIIPSMGKKPTIKKRRDTEVWSIKHYVITSNEILKGPEDFPGKYIPIVLVLGETINIEGKTYVEGLIRHAKDPQRLFNYWSTVAAEVIGAQPKAPWLGTQKQFEGYENDFATANNENFPYLTYNHVDGVPAPTRVSPAQPPTAIFSQIASAEQNIRSTIGMFQNDVGEMTPERTGAAVIAKQTPGDNATFNFFDEFKKAIATSGKIINEMIPEIYDSERDTRLRDVDDSETLAPLNTTAGAALKEIMESPEKYDSEDVESLISLLKQKGPYAKFNDMGVGKYDVKIVVGPSYATQRQSASESMMRLVSAYPQLMNLAGDLVVGNMDFKDADVLADRLKKTLPQGIEDRKEGDPPRQPLPPSPQMLLMKGKIDTESLKQQREIAATKLQLLKIYKESKSTDTEIRKQILKVLSELTGPQHPADALLNQNVGQGENING